MASLNDRSSTRNLAGWWRWGILSFLSALRSQTVVTGGPPKQGIGTNAVFYPLIGLLLGSVALLVDWGSSHFGGLFARSSAVLVATLACTAARPHRALGQLMQALLLRRDRGVAVRVLEGPDNGTSLATATLIALIELACLCQLDRFRLVGLLFAPTLARCSMVVLAVGSRAARLDGRRRKFAPDLTFNEFALASVLTFSIIFLTSEFLGLLLVLGAALLTIGLRVLFHRWLDGVTPTILDAACEVSTLATLGLLLLF